MQQFAARHWQQHGSAHAQRAFSSSAMAAQSSDSARGKKGSGNVEVPGMCPSGLMASEVLLAAEEAAQLPPAVDVPAMEAVRGRFGRSQPPKEATSAPDRFRRTVEGNAEASRARSRSDDFTETAVELSSGDREARAKRGAPLLRDFAAKASERLTAEVRAQLAQPDSPANDIKPIELDSVAARLLASYVLGSDATRDDAELAALLDSQPEGIVDAVLAEIDKLVEASRQGHTRMRWGDLLMTVCMLSRVLHHVYNAATVCLVRVLVSIFCGFAALV